MENHGDHQDRLARSLGTTDIETILINHVQELRQKCPNLSQLIHVLKTANDQVTGQLKQRFQEAKTEYCGARIILFLYYLGDAHWIGFIITFKHDDEITSAEFINPVKDSNIDRERFSNIFKEVFPNNILCSMIVERQNNREYSGQYVIANMLHAIHSFESKEYVVSQTNFISELVNEQSSNISEGSVNKSLVFESKVKSSLTEDDEKSPKKVPHLIRQMSQTYEQLKKQLQNEFEEHEIRDEDDLNQMIREMNESIQSLIRDGKQKTAEKKKEFLSQLEKIQLLVERIKTFEYEEPKDDLDELQKKLNESLQKREISKEEVKQEILKKEHEFQSAIDANKPRTARARQDSLDELKTIQSLIDKIDSERPRKKKLVNFTHQEENSTDSLSKDEFNITKQSLTNLYHDFISMPSFSERYILSLLFYVSYEYTDRNIVFDDTIEINNNIETEIEKDFQCLKQRLQIENLLTADIQNLTDEIHRNLTSKQWKHSLVQLDTLCKNLIPLNMYDLFRLVDRVDDTAEIIKGKDIIFFLGGTGSGKSTTIHFLGGSKLDEKVVRGLYHIAPTEITNLDLIKVTTSPFATSETRCITPVTVYFEDVGAYNTGSIILCDSPGFEDTSGPEVDIANGIGIVKAIKQCKSVKPVVLVSYKSIGDRFEGLKKFTRILAGLIPGIHDQIKSFSYLFTKFPPNEHNKIHAILKNVFKTMGAAEKSDTNFMNLFKDMLHKTEEMAICIDPINGKPGRILDKLAESVAIQHPENVFHFSITDTSKETVKEQVRKQQLSIISATERNEYLIIKYKLDQLERLNNLLNLEYIKTAYENCVQHVIKHVNDEYTVEAERMSRCLLNQTTILDQDIRHYQIAIEHVKSAEILQEHHLRKETVHSAAFHSYLNDQLKILADELKEKDFDDLTIKYSLDKIKLVFCSFTTVDANIYKSSCQILSEKIDVLEKRFKEAVSSNKFDECASHMERLFESSTILKGHLDSEDIQRIYTNLKAYFLKYLNDSCKDVISIFNKDHIEERDVQKLDECVLMIENALITYNLHTHISRENINKIYEEFSLKIITLFKIITQRINVECTKANGYTVIKQLMNELDLIRKISGFDSKTSELYYNTLERLIGFIYESRRTAENILKDLFRHERRINYESLKISLANLRSASWLEKYREGIYKDLIKDVEQQIIEHVKELNTSVEKVKIDLDHCENLRTVSKVISEIICMKQIQDLVPDVTTHINSAESWFENVTKNTFFIIRDTFSIEKWDQQQYKSFDSNKAEKAFHYLDECKEIPFLIGSDLTSVLNNLEKFIRHFSDCVQAEMQACFELITQYQSGNKKDILLSSRTLAERLKEIMEIKEKCPRIFSYFSKKTIIENWIDELSNYLNDLSNEMGQLSLTKQTEDLNRKITIAQVLSKLDCFLGDDKYGKLYSRYQEVFLLQTSDVEEQIIKAIKDFDYQTVASKMINLEKSTTGLSKHLYEETKRPLNAGVERLIEETRNQAIMLGNNVEVDAIRSIVKNLKHMENAKQFTSKYLNDPSKIDSVIQKEIKPLIEEKILRFLESIKALINIHHFYEADEKIESITLVRTLLENFRTKRVSDEIDEIISSQNKVISKDVVNQYSEMDISQYSMHPPTDIFLKFEQVNAKKPIYTDAIQSIRNIILAKCRAELESAKSFQPPNSENVHIRRFETAIRHLPQTMRDDLEIKLKYCKDDIEKLKRDKENDLTNAFDGGNVKEIKQILEEYKNVPGMQSFFNRGAELALKQAQELIKSINRSIETCEIREALSTMKILYEYKTELENVVCRISQPYSEIKIRMIKIFDDSYLCVMNRFFNPNQSMLANGNIEIVEKCLTYLIEFIRFKDKLRNEKLFIQLFSETLNGKTDSLIKQITSYSVKHREKYLIALAALDVSTLISTIDMMIKWSSVFIKVESYGDKHSINEMLVLSIVESFKQYVGKTEILEAVSERIENLFEDLKKTNLINEKTKSFKNQRDEFYRDLNEKFSILKKAKAFSNYGIRIDVINIELECIADLENKVGYVVLCLEDIANRVSNDLRLTKDDFDRFNIFYNNLVSFNQEVQVKLLAVCTNTQNIDKIIFDKIEYWANRIEKEEALTNISTNLIHMKRTANNIPTFAKKINERIDELVNNYRHVKGAQAFAKLGTILNQDKSAVGQTIISEHRAFTGFSLAIFNQKVQVHDYRYVLTQLTGTDIDKKKLTDRYEEFDGVYKKLVQQYLQPTIELDKLVADLKFVVGSHRQKPNKVEWDATIRDKIPTVIANIFAWWTLKNAEHYFEAEGLENKANYLFKPHAAQIISIFRMLSIGDSFEELRNNLVEIGTGEGKSVTLAVTASVLALFGFDVHCACYSDYLSHRDYSAFTALFDAFGLTDFIHYGTFNKLCEDIINEKGDIRQLVEQFISNNPSKKQETSQITGRSKILLIDEVDVFFSRDFYGEVYTPSARLRDPTIINLVRYIWSQRKIRLNLNKVKSSQEYIDCCKRFPNWELLIQEAIKDMIADVSNFESHDYVVFQDKVGYREQDNIVYDIVYGYKTLFAYIFQHENGRISDESVKDRSNITIKCGSFSYAEIPLEFQYIMGVTGTLETLTSPEKEVIQTVYRITKSTFMPSVFGKNQLQFVEKDDIMIENRHDYFNRIKREIDVRLIGRKVGKAESPKIEKRAVLVVFESKKKLMEFYDSSALAPIKDSVAILTEEASATEKEYLIKHATVSGQVTLLTRTFGRGTDFVCNDQTVNDCGGTHVIQTFLSEEYSEEKQIKGRTARQGEYGSYSMILLDTDLEKFQIEMVDVDDVKKGKKFLSRLAHNITNTLHLTKSYDHVYDLLHHKRTEFFKTQYTENVKYVKQAKERHLNAKKFLVNLHLRNIDSVRTFLIEENRGVAGLSNSRTVCLMDGTGSMYNLLHKCKNTVDTMFQRASQILKTNGISPDSFEIQFVVYRNYNSPKEKILQSSPWETKPHELRAFLNTIDCEGGMGNEAVEIGLWHANKEHEREPITQVILIGDAPPNTDDEIIARRQYYGEKYWKATKFSQSTTYKKELDILKKHEIPVHAFYVDKRAEEAFRQISVSGGRCQMLDIHSDVGADLLTDLVTEEILQNVGGQAKGKDLVRAYRKAFPKSYIRDSLPSETKPITQPKTS